MKQEDTIRLLQECDVGTQMGYDSLSEVCGNVKDPGFKKRLESTIAEHEALKAEVQTILNTSGAAGKSPNPIAKGMSWLKTNAELLANPTDGKVADLVIDGCNMGVKTICRDLNQYADADESAKALAKKLIRCEESLAMDIRQYL